MKKFLAGATAIAAMVAMSPAAHAAKTYYAPGSPEFQISGNPATGPVSAGIQVSGIAAGDFDDVFSFTVGANGLGSGGLLTTASSFHGSTDLDFTSITVNGTSIPITTVGGGLAEFASLSGFKIAAGAVNTIEVTGLSRGDGSYGGNATFTPTSSVPELATWGMMILGFGVVGSAMRRQRSSTAGYQKGSTNVSFA